MSTMDSGAKVTFYGRDPINIPSPHRFGSMAAIGLAAKAVARELDPMNDTHHE